MANATMVLIEKYQLEKHPWIRECYCGSLHAKEIDEFTANLPIEFDDVPLFDLRPFFVIWVNHHECSILTWDNGTIECHFFEEPNDFIKCVHLIQHSSRYREL